MAHNQNPSSDSAMQMSSTSTPSTFPADLPWPEPLIVLPSLVIRPFHPSDAASLVHHGNNRQIACNMPDRFPHPYTIERATSMIAKAMDPTRSHVYAWCISLTPISPCIGSCTLDPGPDVFSISSEISFWIGQEYWGRGYASAVCKALTDWSFMQEQGITGTKLQRMGAGLFGGNTGGKTVLTRCEFRQEGVMRGMVLKWGEIKDYEIFGIQRGGWEQRKMGELE